MNLGSQKGIIEPIRQRKQGLGASAITRYQEMVNAAHSKAKTEGRYKGRKVLLFKDKALAFERKGLKGFMQSIKHRFIGQTIMEAKKDFIESLQEAYVYEKGSADGKEAVQYLTEIINATEDQDFTVHFVSDILSRADQSSIDELKSFATAAKGGGQKMAVMYGVEPKKLQAIMTSPVTHGVEYSNAPGSGVSTEGPKKESHKQRLAAGIAGILKQAGKIASRGGSEKLGKALKGGEVSKTSRTDALAMIERLRLAYRDHQEELEAFRNTKLDDLLQIKGLTQFQVDEAFEQYLREKE